MSEKVTIEAAPKEVFLSYFHGFGIYESPRLARGWIELRDAKGNILASINGVGEIHLAPAVHSVTR